VSITILHTGQTGVERGAFRAAWAAGLRIGGFCNPQNRDELGALPANVRQGLETVPRTGARAAVYATLAVANAVIIGVPSRDDATSYTGIEALRRAIRARSLFHHIVDPTSDLNAITNHIRELHRRGGEVRLLVTGPRSTRWSDGDRLGWTIVSRLALTLDEAELELGRTPGTD
jgi:hypothetical protein